MSNELRTFAVAHPAAVLLIAWGIVALARGSARRLDATVPPWLPGVAATVLGGAFVSIVLWYVTVVQYSDHAEPGVAAVSWLLGRGESPYPTSRLGQSVRVSVRPRPLRDECRGDAASRTQPAFLENHWRFSGRAQRGAWRHCDSSSGRKSHLHDRGACPWLPDILKRIVLDEAGTAVALDGRGRVARRRRTTLARHRTRRSHAGVGNGHESKRGGLHGASAGHDVGSLGLESRVGHLDRGRRRVSPALHQCALHARRLSLLGVDRDDPWHPLAVAAGHSGMGSRSGATLGHCAMELARG